MAEAGRSSEAARGALWTFLLGNFLIGTGVLLPAGMLAELARAFAVPPATAGLLMLAGGLVVGLGAPVFAALTWRFDRRRLLAGALLLYALGHAASALAPGFGALLALRALSVVAAAVFTPQAAAAAGLIVEPERRAAAIAFIFIGWSVASVAGTPVGAYLAATAGWRAAYALMAVLCLAGAALVWRATPSGLAVAPLDRRAWTGALTSPAILAVLGVTLLSASGQFTIFAYFQPVMADGFGIGAELFSVTLFVFGLAGVAGNAAASRLVGPLGVDRAVALALAAMIAGFALFAAGFGSYPLALLAGCLWGIGTFSSNSLQQSRLVGLAPPLASATVALNTSAVYLGQAVGAAAGGAVIAKGVSALFGVVAAGFVVLALGLSVLAARRGRATL
jgi:predicted MFS family arabinose efflux permease